MLRTSKSFVVSEKRPDVSIIIVTLFFSASGIISERTETTSAFCSSKEAPVSVALIRTKGI